MKRIIALSVAIMAIAFSAADASAEELQKRLSSAKSGDTVTLEAGTIAGTFTLPEGVTLKGAGYGKTIINASGCDNGIVVRGSGAVSDLTIRGAAGANLLIQGGDKVTVRRVRVTGGLVGVSVTDSKACRIENVIADGNRYGVTLAGGEGNVVANCTIAANPSLGISLSSGKGHAAFNNVVTDSATSVNIGQDASEPVLDHNLYIGLNLGKFRGAVARSTLNDWRYLTGQDAHSVNLAVKYEDAAQGKFAVVNVLDWALDRPVVAGWGAAKLAGHDAPAEDINGARRPAAPSLGAIECTAKAPRAAEGTFSVPAGEGLVSAGVFDSNGLLVSYLFQCLPLAEGKHAFWLPSRNYKGREIAAGKFEVRLVKAKMDWQYMGWIANTETSTVPGASASMERSSLAFDNQGRLVVGNHLSEEHMLARCYDGATGKSLWWFNGGYGDGMTVASDGLVYILRPQESRITRLKPASGEIAPWGEKDFGHYGLKDGQKYTGVTSLGEELFYADTEGNVLRVGTLTSPEPTRAIEIKAPSSPSADVKTKTIWIISGETVVALSADGKTIAQFSDVSQPIALAARDRRLAVASSKTGKVHLFDASDPKQLKALSTLGRGDGPDGEILTDRFLFQDGAMGVRLALGPKGELAIGELDGRLLVFDRDGKHMWTNFAIWGWGSSPSQVHPGRMFQKSFTMLLDGEKGTWRLESFHRALGRGTNAGDFTVKDQTFLLVHVPKVGMNFVNFTPQKAQVVSGLVCVDPAKDPWTFRVDDNKDGVVDEKDAIVSTFTDAQGKAVSGYLLANANAKGDLLSSAGHTGWQVIWRCAGLDPQGLPTYRYQDRRVVAWDKADLVSPYSLKPDLFRIDSIEQRPDGGMVGLATFLSSPAIKQILSPGGCDLIGVNKDGVTDWFHPFAIYPGTQKLGAMHPAEDFYVAAMTLTYDCYVVNADGLGMPGFSPPEQANYLGHWVDHPSAMHAFTDAQGKANVTTCDYTWGRNHWFRLRSKEVKTDKAPFEVTADTAAALAALPLKPLDLAVNYLPPTVVKIPKLKEPMKIDGDMQKWRDLNIAPIVMLPEAASGIDNARDCSAILRVAYLGTDLYVQVLRFDDVITHHQPRARFYQGEAVEMCFNGTMEGSKFNMAMTTDLGAVNIVDGWYPPSVVLKQEHSPLVIKVLDAKDVPERKLIESISGLDLSKCKVEVYETKIPMDEKTFAGREKYKIEFKPGQPLRLGFLIDDNDKPGTDLQQFIRWPATYGTDNGAVVVLEE